MSQHPSFAGPDQSVLALNPMINAPPRPVEPDLSSAGISSPGLTDYGDLQSAGHFTPSSNPNDVSMRAPGQQQTPLVEWYTSHVAPWDPIHGRTQNNLRPVAGGNPNYRPSAAPFLDYRSTYNSLSDCETTAPGHLPSDSGYGSLARQSVAEGSLYGDCDRFGDTASVSSHLAGMHLDRPMLTTPESWGRQPLVQSQSVVSVETNRLVCPHCKEKVKTKSELKKHDQKHTKPYYCKAPDCSRHEGFSTPNDVERHMRSCHPEIRSKGKTYKCTIAKCRSKDKKWPRADNFRQHLKKVHRIDPGDDDLEKYVCRPQASPGPDLAGLGTAVEGGLVPLDINPNGFKSSLWAFSTQSTQEQLPRDPCGFNGYMDRQMEFPRQVNIEQEHLAMIARSEHHAPDNLMQMSSLELEPNSPFTQLEPAIIQSQGLQDFTAPSIDDQVAEFDEPCLFHGSSVSEHESEDDEQSVIHHVSEPDLTLAKTLCEEPRALKEPLTKNAAEPDAAPQDVITMDDDGSSAMSTPPASSSAGVDETMPFSSDVNAPSKKNSIEAQLNFSDIIKDQDKAYDLIKALKEQGLLAGLLEKVDYEKVNDAEAETTPDPSARRDVSRNVYACAEQDCEKSFKRPSQLRKHMKRHAKPYCCTHPQCNKRFGSKNDWMRHENSQHYRLELWKCNEKSRTNPGELCDRPFSRREQFKAHLSKDHGIIDSASLATKLQDCLDDRNYKVRFWCGFCDKMVPVVETGLRAWLGRFNHIDHHFSSQMDISDWKRPGVGLQEVELLPTASSKGSQGGSQTAAGFLSPGPESGRRSFKRGADGDAQQPRPRKKARPSSVWYCCLCGDQTLMGISDVCLRSSCRGHEQCGRCTVDAIPGDLLKIGI